MAILGGNSKMESQNNDKTHEMDINELIYSLFPSYLKKIGAIWASVDKAYYRYHDRLEKLGDYFWYLCTEYEDLADKSYSNGNKEEGDNYSKIADRLCGIASNFDDVLKDLPNTDSFVIKAFEKWKEGLDKT